MTNVYWPFSEANGGYVNYLRLGYGKHRSLVQDMAEKAGVSTEITNYGERIDIAFYCATQLQLGINFDSWWINLYIDRKGWLEQYNLIEKIKEHKKQFIELLAEIANEEYYFCLYSKEECLEDFEDKDPSEFVSMFQEYNSKKYSFNISIEKRHNRDDNNNNEYILDYLKGEFLRLLPLYRFISWHPTDNNFIGIR